MPKIKSRTTSYLEQPCPRCGSKRKISRIWKEEIATFNGVAVIQHSQSICTNSDCQASFDANLVVEKKKRDDMRIRKEKDTADRKAKKKKKRYN